MKVFISQPMRNKSREEILNSRAAAKRILENYYSAPIEIIDSFIEDSEDKTPVYLLGQAISKMADADLVLLFDDVFSELDIKKRNKLLKIINENETQSIITTTDLKNINKKYIDKSAVFIVKNGVVERK